MFKKKSKADALNEKLQRALQEKTEQEQTVAQVLRETLGERAETWYNTRLANSPSRLVTEAGEWVSEFKANGTTYYIRNPKEGLPLRRAMELEKMSVVVPFNAGLGEIIGSLQRMKQIANTLVGTSKESPNLTGLIEEIVNLERGLRGEGERKWDASLVMCTLFILRPGEDLKQWDMHQANAKIEDWAAEGLLYEDFFSLAMQWSSRKVVLQANIVERIKRGLRVFGFQDL